MSFFKKAALAYIVPSLYSMPFATEVGKGVSRPGSPDVQTAVALDASSIGAGTVRFAGQDVPGDSAHLPVVSLFGTMSQGVNERSSNLTSIEIEVEIADAERDFDILVATYRGKLRGLPVAITQVGATASHIAFEGVLDSYRKSSDGDWKLRIKPNDKALVYGETPKVKFLAADFADIDPAVAGQYVPVWLGDHDSQSITDTGAVICYRVDTVRYWDAVGLGKVTVDRVYKAGVLQAESAYAITYPIINGKQFTVIDWVSNPSSTEITADIRGIGSVSGDGFYYAAYSNPAYQMLWVLANLIFTDWRSGAYATLADVPVDVNSFRALGAYFDRLGYTGSNCLQEPAKGEAILNLWADGVNVKLFWTERGKIAAKVLPLTPDERAYLRTWVQGDVDGAEIGLPYDSSQITRSYEVEHLFLDAENAYQETLVAMDTEVAEKVTISKQLPWSEAKV